MELPRSLRSGRINEPLLDAMSWKNLKFCHESQLEYERQFSKVCLKLKLWWDFGDC